MNTLRTTMRVGWAVTLLTLGAGCLDGSKTCDTEFTSPDSYEPNDSLEAASTLVPGAEVQYSIHCSEGTFSADYVRLQTEAGRIYSPLSITVTGGRPPLLQYFDPEGHEVHAFVDLDYAGDRTWLSPAEGAYTLRFAAAYEDPVLADGNWEGSTFGLRFDEIEGDDFEPDDTIPSAKAAQLGTLQTRTLTYSSDVDVLQLPVEAGARVHVFVPPDQLSPTITPVVEILDGAGTELAAGTPLWSPGSPGPGECCAGGYWDAPAAGTYYVRFSHDAASERFFGPRTYKIEVAIE